MAEKLLPKHKQCFVIAPIGEEGSDTRKRSDQILEHIILPPLQQYGYEATRADQIDKPGMITSQVINRIIEDPLVIADLTDHNPNVFYELAIRHAAKLPVIQIIKKGQSLPFDISDSRTIFIDHHCLDSARDGRESLAAQIRAIEEDPEDIESPITTSIDLQRLRQSDNPEERTLADIVSDISEIKSALRSLKASGGNRSTLSDDICTDTSTNDAIRHLIMNDVERAVMKSELPEELRRDYWKFAVQKANRNPPFLAQSLDEFAKNWHPRNDDEKTS